MEKHVFFLPIGGRNDDHKMAANLNEVPPCSTYLLQASFLYYSERVTATLVPTKKPVVIYSNERQENESGKWTNEQTNDRAVIRNVRT